MSKYLTYASISEESISTRDIEANLETSLADLASCKREKDAICLAD